MRDTATWDATNEATNDPSTFARDVAPLLQTIPIQLLIQGTGLSAIYCRQVRAGKRVPHPRHWDALRSIAQQHGRRIPDDWDTAFYIREIAPALNALSITELVAATGLSVPYCKRIRRGEQMPRRHHWSVLVELVGLARREKPQREKK
jgi:hypothetical protein